MCVGYFLVLLDVTIVNVALPSIGEGLGSTVAGLQWVVDGYALPLASLLLASGTTRRQPRAAGLLIAAVGVGLLATWTADTRYPSLLPAMLAWGIGLGILTPAVVDAAVSAAPADKSGLASGVNNTARQAGGALGIAAYGAIAGQPSQTQTFLTGLHLTGLVTAGLFGAAAFATAH
jgi:MFS family permease